VEVLQSTSTRVIAALSIQPSLSQFFSHGDWIACTEKFGWRNLDGGGVHNISPKNGDNF
jgi:hypothetical protein